MISVARHVSQQLIVLVDSRIAAAEADEWRKTMKSGEEVPIHML
jgi:hypothetical protein